MFDWNREHADGSSVRRAIRMLTAGAGALSVAALAVSLMSGWLIVKLCRSVGQFQKTMAVVRNAAQLYLDREGGAPENGPTGWNRR